MLAAGPGSRTRSGLLRDLVLVGLQHAEELPALPVPVQTPAREPKWGPEMRALHAQGLTNAQIAAALNIEADTVRQRLFRLRLPANRER